MMRIRSATLHDMPGIKRIARDVIRHNYPAFLGEEATRSFVKSGMSDQEIEDGIGRCVVLETGGAIAAFAITKGQLLHLIMVDVPFQRGGYGAALLTHVEGELFRQYGRIRLQTFQENTGAIRFYEKHGWQRAGQEDVPEMGLIMVQYEKVNTEPPGNML